MSEKKLKPKKIHPVIVKCPKCGEERTEMMEFVPSVKPRIFCAVCDYLRYSNSEDETIYNIV